MYRLTRGDQVVYLLGTMHAKVKTLPAGVVEPIQSSEIFLSEISESGPVLPETTNRFYVFGSISPEASIAAFEVLQKIYPNRKEMEKIDPAFLSDQVEKMVYQSSTTEEREYEWMSLDHFERVVQFPVIFDSQLAAYAKEHGLKTQGLESEHDFLIRRCASLLGVAYLEKRAYDQKFQKNSQVWKDCSSAS